MPLKFTKLRLQGFKSFVDPTDLIINDGLTGVVGPNGCGKSNLLEALRWVMGENRPTAMRGGGMEDVIFAGASSRPAKNFAEVSLLLDNSDRLAPQGFNETDGVEIVRRITRDVGSAYKANGKDVRARDIQMLFADASTGAHSPALVRQGQISELINAKPKARRRILEEAAGISGLYQRRHEAELKLKAAEGNLERVDDVIDQLANQLGQLQRQAKQAQRYRQIGEELRRAEGLLLYRRWREADEARARAEEALRQASLTASQAEAEVRKANAGREEAEAMLPPLREEEAVASAILQRLTVTRDALSDQEKQAEERIRTLQARITQLAKDIDREAGLNRDAGETIERLEWEERELAKASEGHDEKLELSSDQAREAADILAEREADLSERQEDVARLSARHQSVQRLLSDTRRTLEKAEAEGERARQAVAEAKAALEEARAGYAQAEEEEAIAQAQSEAAEIALSDAESARAAMQDRETAARSARAEAEGSASTLRAEVGALTKLVARDESDSAPLLDQLQVHPGYEKALGAALADDLRQPAVDGGASGWVRLPDYAVPQALPSGVMPLTEVVKAPAVLTRRLSQIGVVSAAEGARLHSVLAPGQRLVTAEGDLWRWDGLQARGEDAPSAAALRLEQLNKLERLRSELDDAEGRAEEARYQHEEINAELADLARADAAARDARRQADQQVAEAGRRLSRLEAERNLAEGKLETLGLSVRRHADDAMAAREQLSEAEASAEELGDLDAARAEIEDLKMTVEAARMTMMTKRSMWDSIKREGEARTKRSQQVKQELSGWRHRLETATQRAEELAIRKEDTEYELEEASAAPEELAIKREELGHSIEDAEARRAAAGDALAAAENALRAADIASRDMERQAGEARESRARAEARVEAARETVAAAADRIEEEQEVSPDQLLEQLDADPANMPASEEIEEDVLRLRRQRDALGAVNLRAEEDMKEVAEEHDTLVGEKHDLEEAIKALRTGIAGLNKEGRARLLAAFDQVNENFSLLFTHLFNGGEAKLVMVESDDPLDAGLEIMCQPPGKKLSVLSLLSGGEQTLTALALIFAVFLANPAPICVLDEVDAPLDDANVTRFCDLLDEMTRRTDTRFLIITHHAVTMARMDRLFGVTMAEQGVSQLVSVDLKRAEAMVA
ncbi:condensin subunit Smc [Donghicola tyrosinivorans]|uniref:Chromosome partition protein Smc n=1 Tax=Donghicola tyrosinivorans TaxID=1652492 RepID=A0A2T0WM65_9RHOB|nr:condensin subunit Smc [Donghicola tyrosinivorans]